MQGGIHGCHCSLTINQQAPVLATGLSCLAVRVQCLLVAVCCSHCCAMLLSPHCCAWERSDNSNGHTPGLAGGQGTVAVPVLARLELLCELLSKGLCPVGKSRRDLLRGTLKCLWSQPSPDQSTSQRTRGCGAADPSLKALWLMDKVILEKMNLNDR